VGLGANPAPLFLYFVIPAQAGIFVSAFAGADGEIPAFAGMTKENYSSICGSMALRIATWNINSVRIRIPLIKKMMEIASPDIICLQETKVEDPHFPLEDLKSLGFSHIYFSARKAITASPCFPDISSTKSAR
jgi:hypothetical protein